MYKVDTKLREEIRQFGWYVVNVQPERGEPPYSYSIGLFATFGHPEITVVGLPRDRAHRFINTLAEEVKQGATFEAGSHYEHIIEGYEVAFVAVAQTLYGVYFGRAVDYYAANSFPIVQMVWPDRNHVFPWEPTCEAAIRKLQPLLVG